jgi:hypothetical protein
MMTTEAPEQKSQIIGLVYQYLIYLPRIQKIAEPAPTITSNGMQRQSTAEYC